MTEPEKVHKMRSQSNFSYCGLYFPYFQTFLHKPTDCLNCLKTHEFESTWELKYPGEARKKVPFKLDYTHLEYNPLHREFLSEVVGEEFVFEGIIANMYRRKATNRDKLRSGDGELQYVPTLNLQNVTIGDTIVADHTFLESPSYWWNLVGLGYRIRFSAQVSEYRSKGQLNYGLYVADSGYFYVLTRNATKLKGVGYYAVRSMGR